MKRLFVVLAFTLFIAATAEAQTCSRCYFPPDGWGAPGQCGISIYNGAESCRIDLGYICTLTGTCIGSGPGCTGDRHCPSEKWAAASQLPDKARWVVATVEIRQPQRERSRS